MSGPVRVLQSFGSPGPKSNPYVVQLVRALESEGIAVRYFSWKTAFSGKYDVFHIHWPEQLYARRRRIGTAWALLGLITLLFTLRVRRIPVVRTLHNQAPHDVRGKVHRFAYRAVERSTRVTIVLDKAHLLDVARQVAIPHGHYIDWMSAYPKKRVQPNRVLFFGLIRPYKNVESLISAFGGVHTDGAALEIVGQPATRAYGEAIIKLAHRNHGITVRLKYVDDADLVSEITRSQLIVLPYGDLYNSGSLILALSLKRPVLVPDSPIARSIAAEVGDGWITLYSGELSSSALESALEDRKIDSGNDAPDLTERSWADAGKHHSRLYRRVLGKLTRNGGGESAMASNV